MIEEAIKNLPQQFAFEPEVKNAEKLKPFESLVIGGMGGSGLIAGILRTLKPEMDIAAHPDYGLPAYLKDNDKRLFLAISYSGGTEEAINFFEEALKKQLNVAAIAIGGKLLEIAKASNAPFVQIPDTGIEPRMGTGLMLRGTLKIINDSTLFLESSNLANTLKSEELGPEGQRLADLLFQHIPVIYSSRRNIFLAYTWKIRFNETGKAPAFYNVFPELNHNELQGFDVKDSNRQLSSQAYFVFIEDSEDNPRIIKRMTVTRKLYEERGLPVLTIKLQGSNRLERMFNIVILADWVSYYSAKKYSIEPSGQPLVDEFKKLI